MQQPCKDFADTSACSIAVNQAEIRFIHLLATHFRIPHLGDPDRLKPAQTRIRYCKVAGVAYDCNMPGSDTLLRVLLR